MRLRKLVERRRVSDRASRESLRPLSAHEVRQVTGAVYYYADQTAPEPDPGLPSEPPFPPELNPLPS
jgi:hypothetical protein